MSDNIKAGDVVVAVGASSDLIGPREPSSRAPSLRRYYRVEYAWRYGQWLGIRLADGPASQHPDGVWDARCFRKIDPADDQFVADIRACRPIREKADA